MELEDEGDEIIDAEAVMKGASVLTVSELGMGKRTDLDEYRGQRRGGRCVFAGQMVEDHRFADIRAADNRHDQQRRQFQLRQKLVGQQRVPFFALRRRDSNRGRRRLQSGQSLMQTPHLAGKRFIVGGHFNLLAEF